MNAAGLPSHGVKPRWEAGPIESPHKHAAYASCTSTVRRVFVLVRGLYTAASGALVAQAQADTIANNLANVNTSGFKRTLLQVQSAPVLNVFALQNVPASNPGGRPSAQYVGAALM